MALAVDSATSFGTGATNPASPQTYTLDNAAGTVLYVWITIGAGAAVVVATGSVTYDGVAMTKIGEAVRPGGGGLGGAGGGRIFLYRLLNPSTGSKTVSFAFTRDGTVVGVTSAAVSLTGNDGTTPEAQAVVTANGNGTNGSVALTGVAAGNISFAGIGCGSNITAQTQTNQWTQNVSTGSDLGSSRGSRSTSTGSVTHGFTNASDSWAAIAVEVKAAAGGSDATVTGVRATAAAAGRTGSPRVGATGGAAAATVAGRAGSPKAAVTGSRASAAAAGRAGSPHVAVTGQRALVSAVGKPGAAEIVEGQNALVVGVRATCAVTGRAGAPKVTVTGSNAAATATGKAGSPRVTVTGARAAVTAAGNAGVVVSGNNVTVAGVRATCAASGRAGSSKVAVTGARAAVAATGRAGSAKVAVTGARAPAAVAGRTGSPRVAVTGARAVCVAFGKPGSASTSGAVTIIGARATCAAAGRAGSSRVALTGARAASACSGRAGSPRVAISCRAVVAARGNPGDSLLVVTGVRAVCHVAGNAGGTGQPAETALSRRTRTSGPSAVTILATRNGRTNVRLGSSRTRTGTPPTG